MGLEQVADAELISIAEYVGTSSWVIVVLNRFLPILDFDVGHARSADVLIKRCNFINKQKIKVLSKVGTLRIAGCFNIQLNTLKWLRALKNLHKLEFGHQTLSISPDECARFYKLLSSFKRLVSIKIGGNGLVAFGINQLSNLALLRDVSFEYNNIGIAWINMLNKSVLRASYCGSTSSNFVTNLDHGTHKNTFPLLSLSLDNIINMEHTLLSLFPYLETLSVSSCSLSKSMVLEMRKRETLISLCVSHNSIGNSGFMKLIQLPLLRVFNAVNCNLTADVFQQLCLKEASLLRHLDISMNKVAECEILQLCPLPVSLVFLGLSFCGICNLSENARAYLRTSSIRYLSLADSRLACSDIEFLTTLSSLVALDLTHCRFMGEYQMHKFRLLPYLKFLSLPEAVAKVESGCYGETKHFSSWFDFLRVYAKLKVHV
eukprot:snap_masked-scaffold_15-processed-gene-2.36-mRNA-1 protein AED:1.00 eAED:1.00 QI:0/0/0/0/1/1/2/0/431